MINTLKEIKFKNRKIYERIEKKLKEREILLNQVKETFERNLVVVKSQIENNKKILKSQIPIEAILLTKNERGIRKDEKEKLKKD